MKNDKNVVYCFFIFAIIILLIDLSLFKKCLGRFLAGLKGYIDDNFRSRRGYSPTIW